MLGDHVVHCGSAKEIQGDNRKATQISKYCQKTIHGCHWSLLSIGIALCEVEVDKCCKVVRFWRFRGGRSHGIVSAKPVPQRWGTGTGSPGKPQGYPCQSLPQTYKL